MRRIRIESLLISLLAFLLLSLSLEIVESSVLSLNNVESVGSTLKLSTLDKVKLIRHIPTGKCLIIENRDPPVGKHGGRIVLWECHDVKHIAGLEQEMFTLARGYDRGLMLMGFAGSLNHCPFAGREYYDTLEVTRCDPESPFQSFTFRRIPGTVDSHQIVHMASGRCLRVPSAHDGAWVRSGDCDYKDKHQTWRICGLDKDCSLVP